MEHGHTVLTDAVRSVQLLKIDGYGATAAMERTEYIGSKWNIDGHEWEVQVYPKCYDVDHPDWWVAMKLILLGQPQKNKLKVNLSCRLVDRTRRLAPSAEKSVPHVFPSRDQRKCTLFLERRVDIPSSGYLVDDSLTVQCSITVLKELPDIVIPQAIPEAPLPPSELGRQFGELWQGQWGADVTFVLESGEHVPAHKLVLAAGSAVFKAEFFGHMNERSSQSVRIEDMEADVFKAMLHFIYTDTAPELEQEPEAAVAMAQHLLVAADRYGLDRLKLMCGSKLSGSINIDTVATTLALAEQHNCSLLKSKCVEFIAKSPETFDAVVATKGYNHLVASCPMVLTELVRAAHGWRT